MNKIGGGRYIVGEKLGSGSYGEVYKARDKVAKEDVAIKLEVPGHYSASFRREAYTLSCLKGLVGFPNIKLDGISNNVDFIVMELLGEDLSSLRSRTVQNMLDLKSVLLLALQLVDRLETLHGKGYVHCDLKPANMAMGRTEKTKGIVHLIDFGQCVTYRNACGRINNILERGTLLFSSIASHSRGLAVPKEDMECLGYVLVYLLEGTLPWMHIEKEKRDDIFAMKIACRETLCASLPEEFGIYMNYIYGLTTNDVVDYEYARAIFNNLLERADLVNDGVFSWPQPEPLPPTPSRFAVMMAWVPNVPNVPTAVTAALKFVWRERVNKITPEHLFDLESISSLDPPSPGRKRAGGLNAAELPTGKECDFGSVV